MAESSTVAATVLTSLNIADYIIIGIIIFSILLSLVRGFVREFLSIVTWIIAFWIAFNFDDSLAPYLSPYIHTPSLCIIASFIVMFLLTLIVGSLINFSISKLITGTGLGGIDRLLGMIFGLARGVLLIGVILLLLSLTAFSQDAWWKNSLLIPHFKTLVMWLNSFLPEKLEHFSSMFKYKI